MGATAVKDFLESNPKFASGIRACQIDCRKALSEIDRIVGERIKDRLP